MNLPRLPAPIFDDGRGLYPERLTFNAPRGLRELAKQAAEAEGVSLNEFSRRAFAQRISLALSDKGN